MISVNPEKVWSDVIKDVSKTGNVTEYSPEVTRAMQRYAGLCMSQLLEEGKIKAANLNEYMEIRFTIDNLVHGQK
jgi:hypothetical protein